VLQYPHLSSSLQMASQKIAPGAMTCTLCNIHYMPCHPICHTDCWTPFGIKVLPDTCLPTCSVQHTGTSTKQTSIMCSQHIQPVSQLITPSGQSCNPLELRRMTKSPVIPTNRNGIVVGVHLFANIPIVTIGAVAILLHPPIAKMVFSPPLLVPVCTAIHAPCLAL